MKHIALTILLIFGATAVIASDVEQAWLFTELEIYESDPDSEALIIQNIAVALKTEERCRQMLQGSFMKLTGIDGITIVENGLFDTRANAQLRDWGRVYKLQCRHIVIVD